MSTYISNICFHIDITSLMHHQPGWRFFCVSGTENPMSGTKSCCPPWVWPKNTFPLGPENLLVFLHIIGPPCVIVSGCITGRRSGRVCYLTMFFLIKILNNGDSPNVHQHHERNRILTQTMARRRLKDRFSFTRLFGTICFSICCHV